jgi:hypothetical protein
MALANRNLEAGTRLVARYKGQTHKAEVVQTEGGLRYRLEDGREFKSPSSAGSAVKGGKSCNGWDFWSLDGQEQPPKEPKTKAKGKGSKFRTIKKLPNQQGLEEGQVRYWCSACQKSFVVEDGQEPEACPEGHRNDEEEPAA